MRKENYIKYENFFEVMHDNFTKEDYPDIIDVYESCHGCVTLDELKERVRAWKKA